MGRVNRETAGAKQSYQDLGDNVMMPENALGAVSAAALLKGGTPAEIITCTNANTDYAVSNAMPAGTKYVTIYADNDVVIAMGEATSTTIGIGIGAGLTIFPVTVTGTAADDKVHAQSATAGATVRCTYLAS